MKISETCTILDDLSEFGGRVAVDSTLSKAIHDSCRGFDLLVDIFRKEVSKRVLVDSSANIRLAYQLAQAQQWKIILLTRDPRGIMCSQKKADLRHNIVKPLSRRIHSLVDFAHNARTMMSMNNVLFIRYEDLCSQPVLELKRISDFLYMDFDIKMLKFRTDRGHIVMGNRMRFGGSEEIVEDLSWISDLSLIEKQMVYNNPELVSLYGKLGYDLLRS